MQKLKKTASKCSILSRTTLLKLHFTARSRVHMCCVFQYECSADDSWLVLPVWVRRVPLHYTSPTAVALSAGLVWRCCYY